ncbi:MAG: BTAD domain-containing putative transcriptional regulator [Caldilineaceae bacterium]
MEILSIRLLGEFSFVYDGAEVPGMHGDRVQSLLAWLLLHPDAPQSRQHLAFLFWPDSPESQARTNLRNLLHTLRQSLPEAGRFLAATNLTLQWQGEGVCLDVDAFRNQCQAAEEAQKAGNLAAARAAWEDAVAVYRGELLPGNYDDWIIPVREGLRDEYDRALERLILLLEETGELREALRYSQQRLLQDPLNEAAYVAQMRLYAALGDRAGIRRVYEQAAALLRRELDVEPAPSTQAAYADFLRAAPEAAPPQPRPITSTPSTPSPSAAAAEPPTRRAAGLPVYPIAFVGREKEQAELAQLLADPDCRLATIVGPGGMGKTRLATQTARGHASVFQDGVVFVGLSGVTDPTLLGTAIAENLADFRPGAGRREEQLLDFLAEREMLLVLDNFEQLVEGADFLSQVLHAAPQVKLLVTSRVRLQLAEEWVYDLNRLPLPPVDEAGWADNSAAQLFVQSARRVRAGFAPNASEQQAISHICALVEGLPLALVLAGAWVRMLSPAEIAQEIEHNLAFLESDQRNAPERHRSLTTVFEHSWQLLAEEERAVLRRLAVFRRGADRRAAESVAGATLTTLATLVDNSLLRRDENGRYSLHEVIRQFSLQKLEAAGEAALVRDRHLAWFAQRAEALDAELFRQPEGENVVRFAADLHNLRAALSWAYFRADQPPLVESLQSPTLDESLRLGVALTAALGRFWYMRSNFHEGYSWLRRALRLLDANPTRPVDPHLRARVLFGVGDLLGAIGDLKHSLPLLLQSVDLLRQSGDQLRLIHALHRATEVGSSRPRAEVEGWLAESLALTRGLNNTWLLGRTLFQFSMAAQTWGEIERAVAFGQEALPILRGQTAIGSVIAQLNILAQLAIAQDDASQAIALLEEALALSRARVASLGSQAWTVRNLGYAYQSAGDFAKAVACYGESLEMRQRLGQLPGVAWSLEGLGEIALLQGGAERAVRLWAAASRLRQESHDTLTEREAEHFALWLEKARNQLGEVEYEQTWAAGTALGLEDVVAYALAAG